MSKRRNSTEEVDEIIDSDEQDEIIESLRKEADEQNVYFRRIFSFTYLFVGTMLLMCFGNFLTAPFTLPFESIFRGLVSESFMLSFYFASVFVMYSQAAYILKVWKS